jgi:hypothetical protein
MKLQYGFPQKVRLLYLYHYSCFLCGSNGSNCGGLEIHHILGRVSDSAFNSSCLCKKCHSKIGHTKEEHQMIFFFTIQFLKSVLFKPAEEDMRFLENNFEELVSLQTAEYISKLST